MAARNGISINSIPFERRCPPQRPRPRKREPLPFADRLICFVWGTVLALLLWTSGYIFVAGKIMKHAAQQGAALNRPVDPMERLPPFRWGWAVAAGYGLFSAVVGPDGMFGGLGLWGWAQVKVMRASRYS